MTEDRMTNLIEGLLGTESLDLGAFEAAIGTALKKTDENPSWAFYEFDFTDQPFARGELRLAKAKPAALLSLWPDDSELIARDKLDLDRWGEVINIDVNPRIEPEGTVAYVYEVEGARLSFQFNYASETLRSVAIAWSSPD